MLPTEITKATTDLNDKIILLYGSKKVGKSLFASKFPSMLFLAPEPGLGSIDAFKIPINNIDEMREAYLDLKKGSHKYSTVAIDTLEALYVLCEEAVCKEAGEKHIDAGTLGWNHGKNRVNNMLRKLLNQFANLPYGLILISHSREVDITSAIGDYTMIVPGLHTSGKKSTIFDPCSFVVGMADMILYCDVETIIDQGVDLTKHVIKTKPNKYYIAGDRTGKLPPKLPLNYDAFYKAYTANNKTIPKTEVKK